MTTPDVTVLMPVHNGAAYLHEAITSILNQSYPHFRLLIVDDASTDQSAEIVREFQDARIELCSLPTNHGQTVAMNIGLRQISTPLVARIDADDIALPHRLEKQVTFMHQYPAIALLGTWTLVMDEYGGYIGSLHPPTDHQGIIQAYARQNPFVHSSVMFRHAVVQTFGGYPTSYFAQDFALWIRISRQFQVAILPEELLWLRRHRQSQSRQYSTARTLDRLRLAQHVLHFPNLPEITRQEAQHSVAYAILDHAETCSDAHQSTEALRWTLLFCIHEFRFCSQHPALFLKLLRVLLGRRGRNLGRRVKGLLNRDKGVRQ